MNKAHSLKNWEDYPSIDTPLNAQNLNELDVSVDVIDDRVIMLDTTKFNKTEAQGLIKDFSFNYNTGVITITYYNGAKATINTGLAQVAVNFDFDEETQILYVVKADGSRQPVDLSAFITDYEFLDSDTVAFSLGTNGKVSAIVKEGSIEEKHLRPDYLADIKVEAAKAQSSQKSAATSETSASESAKKAKSEADRAKSEADRAETIAGGNLVTGAKGNAESEYRTGKVNITPENIGLGNVDNTADSTKSVKYAANAGNAASADTASRLEGFSNRTNGIEWGKLSASGYNYITRMDTANGGSVAFADSGGQTSMQIDGTYYQREGNYRVLDESDLSDLANTYVPKSGGTFTGNIIIKAGHGDNGLDIITSNYNGARIHSMNGAAYFSILSGNRDSVLRTLSLGSSSLFENATNGTMNLGVPGHRWDQVYAVNPTISTSDRNEKYDISYIGKEGQYDTEMTDERLTEFLMSINPVIFKRINGTSGRPHHGMIAQEIEEILLEMEIDHAGFIKSPAAKQVEIYKVDGEEVLRRDVGEDFSFEIPEEILETYGENVEKSIEDVQVEGEYVYGLRYEEFIGDIIRFCQILKKENEILKQEILDINAKLH